MVEIQSKEVIDKMSDELKVQPAMLLPRELGKMIVPVFNVNASILTKLLKFVNATASDTTAAETIHQAHAKKRTYIVGFDLTIAKDVFAAGTNTRITVQGLGAVPNVLAFIRYEPLTAGNFNKVITFPVPIEVEKGSIISVKHDNATASIDATATVYFYETDPQ